MEKTSKVCVTGGAGYLGSSLVNKLLQRGYTVHATLRNLDDTEKTGLLKSLPHADTRLKLFQADLYNAEEFDSAIRGCEFVFHVATPLQHYLNNSKFKDTKEAAIDGVRNIAESCIRSGTVKRLIYTASVVAVSPMKESGNGYKDLMDESLWSSINLPLKEGGEHGRSYLSSKTTAEKEVLSYNNNKNSELEVVSLACGLVGGDTILPYLPASVELMVSQLTRNAGAYGMLKYLQELLSAVPVVHIEDVCEAHIFSMENKPSMAGRFLCACANPTIVEMADYYSKKYPEFEILEEFRQGPHRGVLCDLSKLTGMGFQYKYDLKKVLDDSVECAKKLNVMK